MGYSFSSETSQATGAFSKNPTIGNTIVVWCWAWDAGGWSSSDITCSDNLATHNTYTQAGFVQNGSAAFCFFYANVANTGAGYTPVITVHSVTDPAISVAASEFSGIASSNPIDGTAVTAVGKGTPASLGKMNVKANDLVLAGLSWNEDSAVRITAPSGWTQSGNALDDGAIDPNQYTEFGDAIYSINPTSPTAPSWSVSGTSSATDTWCASQLAFLKRQLNRDAARRLYTREPGQARSAAGGSRRMIRKSTSHRKIFGEFQFCGSPIRTISSRRTSNCLPNSVMRGSPKPW